ncbi:MAG: formylglycine-generating enzyme family protein [Candidatus Eisenbacteria bacterium]
MLRRLCSVVVIAIILLSPVVSAQPRADEPEQASTTRGVTKSEMVLIPGGEFEMGKEGKDDHGPAHMVYLDEFYMDKYEVTNAQYAEFCEATERNLPEFWGMDHFRSGPDFPNHPVTGISWHDAEAYAEWAGKRLPSESEWEYAARGGLVGKDYPGGDKIDSSTANFSRADKGGTIAVASYPANGFGLHDMVGNVGEWVADYYAGDYYKACPDKNPAGPDEGKFRVFRGGGWHTGPGCSKVFYRNGLPPNWVDFNVGFRCARDR